MKIGIMGGTYNPPHIGHLHAAQAAREQLNLEKIILIPSNIPPHKELPKLFASSKQRLEMTHIAARGIDAEVSDIEITREGKSYTADTLEELKEEHPNDELYFIMGTDMLLTVQDWFEPHRIFAVAKLAVIARNDGDREAILAHIETLKPMGAEICFVEVAPLPISSTELRENICAKKEFLPDGVFEYVSKEHLYEV